MTRVIRRLQALHEQGTIAYWDSNNFDFGIGFGFVLGYSFYLKSGFGIGLVF
jgi:hypothetical protein